MHLRPVADSITCGAELSRVRTDDPFDFVRQQIVVTIQRFEFAVTIGIVLKHLLEDRCGKRRVAAANPGNKRGIGDLQGLRIDVSQLVTGLGAEEDTFQPTVGIHSSANYGRRRIVQIRDGVVVRHRGGRTGSHRTVIAIVQVILVGRIVGIGRQSQLRFVLSEILFREDAAGLAEVLQLLNHVFHHGERFSVQNLLAIRPDRNSRGGDTATTIDA